MGNLALHKTANASGFVAPFTPAMAVNGSATAISRWLCNPVPCWLSVDLGYYYWINRWVVRHMGTVAGWPSPGYNMIDFALQGSNDNVNWVSIDSVTGNTTNVTDRTFTMRQYRYVRVYVTKGLNINNGTASIVEFEVYEAPPTSPYLSNLTISSGTLTPVFSKNTYSYTASVGYGTTSITVTPTGEDSYSIITVNGQTVQSGHASQAINLNVGSNTITVNVTAGVGGARQSYTINVTRPVSQYLSNLTLSSGTLSPAFTKTVSEYTAKVDNSISSITVTPEAEDPTSIIKVNGTVVATRQASGAINLNVGANTITVEVTAADGTTTFTYTVTVIRDVDLYLSGLQVKFGKSIIALTPATFDKTINNYTGSCARTSNLSVTATAESPGDVNLAVKGNSAISGTPINVSVTPGASNLIDIVVISKTTGAANIYNCTITVSN